jgi:hypothetical protein
MWLCETRDDRPVGRLGLWVLFIGDLTRGEAGGASIVLVSTCGCPVAGGFSSAYAETTFLSNNSGLSSRQAADRSSTGSDWT